MPDPVPPAPNPTPPTPSISGYIKPWELVKIVLGTFTSGVIGFEAIVPLLQRLATDVDLWIVDPSYRETVRLVLGAAIAIVSGVTMTRHYLSKGLPPEKLLNFEGRDAKRGS